VGALLADDQRLVAMGEAARTWARPRAAADIATLAEAHARA
jgi:UDP-N-acetylglucosamine:LPS N-acetylglucosamine transferase